jgi:hypothetical protein
MGGSFEVPFLDLMRDGRKIPPFSGSSLWNLLTYKLISKVADGKIFSYISH